MNLSFTFKINDLNRFFIIFNLVYVLQFLLKNDLFTKKIVIACNKYI